MLLSKLNKKKYNNFSQLKKDTDSINTIDRSEDQPMMFVNGAEFNNSRWTATSGSQNKDESEIRNNEDSLLNKNGMPGNSSQELDLMLNSLTSIGND